MNQEDLEKEALEQLKVALVAGSGLSLEGLESLAKENPNNCEFATFADKIEELIVKDVSNLHPSNHARIISHNYDNLFLECKHVAKRPAKKWKKLRTVEGCSAKRDRRIGINNFFRLIELFSHILPSKMRKASFEPNYFELKKDYLLARREYKDTIARKWLCFCFGTHVIFTAIQCVWGMLGDKLKFGVLRFLPEFLRGLGGG